MLLHQAIAQVQLMTQAFSLPSFGIEDNNSADDGAVYHEVEDCMYQALQEAL